MQNTIGQYVIAFILIAAIIGIAYVAAGVMGVAIPPWVITIFWILVCAFVCVGAVKLLIGGNGQGPLV